MPADLLDQALKDRLLASREASLVVSRPAPAPALLHLSKAVQAVSTGPEAQRMVADLARLNVAFVGLDAEFRYGDLADPDTDDDWQDPLTLQPLLIGLVAMVTDPDGRGLVPVRYALDVRRPETHAGLAGVLRQPYLFVAHHLKSELFALAALGLPWPRAVFCTWLAAQQIALGRHHARYVDPSPVDDEAAIGADRAARVDRVGATSLLAQLRLYGIGYPFAGNKDAMRRRFMGLADDAPLTDADREYVTADAYGAAALYLPQKLALAERGLAHHYDTVELPGALALMEIERVGVTVDPRKLRLAYEAATRAVAAYEERLAPYGFREEAGRVMVGSHAERMKVLRRLGLLPLFATRRAAARHSFRKELLKQHQDAHEVIRLLYLHGKYSAVTRDRLFQGEYLCADGRVRPSINPLGADSGRPSFRRPNLVGIGKVLRPIVVPDTEEDELAELDFVAQEVFIAADHFGDPVLLADCNKGDPYCEMIRQFCPGDLTPGDDALDDRALADRLGADRFKALRGRMKILMLATIYGMGDRSIAAQAGVTLEGARHLRRQFFTRYKGLREGILRAQRELLDRGYTQTVTGLRRHRGRSGALSSWEKKWAVNAPIQGGSACILKLLLPRLAAYLHRHGGRLVLPIFDAVLIQYPRHARQEMLRGVEVLMVEAMRELYPGTRPRVDVTAGAPSSWNKNNCADSIERFLADPEFKP
ncbi:MAG: hypothetical protein EPO40_22040 [Myxococcaceae bacterium]|nr:MAG: hypothetical protein EPO40_22040 [Myxococcaceae bacterium]